jgi:hypothetical protein
MLRPLGPSGLLRLATAITLGLSLLAGCGAVVHDRRVAAAMATDGGWRPCDLDDSAALTLVCLQPRSRGWRLASRPTRHGARRRP